MTDVDFKKNVIRRTKTRPGKEPPRTLSGIVTSAEKTKNLKGLSHEIDFKNVDNNLQNLA